MDIVAAGQGVSELQGAVGSAWSRQAFNQVPTLAQGGDAAASAISNAAPEAGEMVLVTLRPRKSTHAAATGRHGIW